MVPSHDAEGVSHLLHCSSGIAVSPASSQMQLTFMKIVVYGSAVTRRARLGSVDSNRWVSREASAVGVAHGFLPESLP